jgi:hypothetical protein
MTGKPAGARPNREGKPDPVYAAADAIEASRTFREHFEPAQPLGVGIHPAAVEFARLALEAGAADAEGNGGSQ